MIDNIYDLNESQQNAVLYTDGPSLVIAGAGSGKTRVLTYKIAHLLEIGYRASSILALTFTNKAAREMKERIANQVGSDKARHLWMGTFHSLFSRILRAEADVIGFPAHFTIYDSQDSKSLLKTILKEMQLDEKVYKPGAVQGRISHAKNQLISPQAYAHDTETIEQDQEAKMPLIRDIYLRYANRCRQAGAMDFDDLLYHTYFLFKNNPAVLDRYVDQFQYVLVDEYQDTNHAQHSIVLQLSEKNQRICVVGDDAQSIYSFRGANIDNILRFNRLYPNAKLFKLEQNYRSTQTIVDAANTLIDKNELQIKKNTFSENAIGERIEVMNAYSDLEEGEIVANKIAEQRLRNHYSYNHFAILYRTNAQSRIFEESLRRHNHPYKIYGGLSFYQRKEIKDLIAYFRMAVNPNDEEAFRRIVNYPVRGIGNTTVAKISAFANQHQCSLWSVVGQLEDLEMDLNKGTVLKLQRFKALIDSFIAGVEVDSADQLAERIVKESGLFSDVFSDGIPEAISRQENVTELINGIIQFTNDRKEEGDERVTLIDYLSEIALLTDQDAKNGDDQERVSLMTIHAAKGLEFKSVFVVGLEENLFPSSMSIYNLKAIEEERRLFYVAITRAEEFCFLSHAKNRFRFGKTEPATPSRFLRDIDGKFLKVGGEAVNTAYLKERSSRFREQNDSFIAKSKEHPSESRGTFVQTPTPNTRLTPMARVTTPIQGLAFLIPEVGQLIEHDRFGRGEVICVEGSGDNCKATVLFQNLGEKQLLLKFAKFRVV